LTELADKVAADLAGDDGVQSRLAGCLREARRLEDLDPASKPLVDRLAAAAIELNDLGGEFGSLAQALVFDPEQAERLQATMGIWLELQRRHGGGVAQVLAARDELARRIEVQGDYEGALARLERRIAATGAEVVKAGRGLRDLRERAAKDLARAGAAGIAELGFKRADFQVRTVPLAEPGPTGDCGCEFLFSPNVGEPPLPLNRVASSGELARVMLALKTVLADLDGIPVLVFDEVDANVGGEIGRVVGEKMARIARGRQVLCVTHLPQVAASGDAHFVVTKDQSQDRTVVSIAPIHASRKERLAELARMLGDRSAKSALAHAEELLGGK
jgi:DNA repair protein RecN (Recombination protein N)